MKKSVGKKINRFLENAGVLVTYNFCVINFGLPGKNLLTSTI